MSSNAQAHVGVTPGELLRGYREQVGLPQQEAARLANLGVSIVAAIESDDYASLGMPVYARGYYRRYAKVVGCDAESVLRAYEDATETASPIPVITQRPSIPYGPSPMQKPLIGAVVIGVLVVLLAYLYWPQGAPNRSDPQSVVELAGGDDHQPSTLGGVESNQNTDDPTPTLMPLPAIRRPVVGDMANAIDASDSANSAATQSAEQPSSARPSEVIEKLGSTVPPNRLEIVLGSEEAWIDVTDALGEKLSYRTASAGETLRFDGEPPYSLSLGRAYSLSVRYGGVELDLSHVMDSAGRARLTVAANGELIGR